MAKEILIADSDKASEKELRKIFGTTDYHLVFSESGEDALLRVKLFKPNLIIAGTVLGEKNGYELCEVIKNDPDFTSIPFILLLNVSEEISDKDRKRLKPDGILSKPLRESQVVTLVDRLLEGVRSKGGGIPGKEMVLETFADMGEERFATSEVRGKEEGEVIDLLEVVEDVVEEPESKMSIDDFVIPVKAEPFGEMASSESWGKLGEEEKGSAEEGFVLSVESGEEKAQDFPFKLKKEGPPPKESQEEDLFEKIELDDILEKIGKIELPPEIEEPAERGLKALKEISAPVKEAKEKPFAFNEFEIALKRGVEVEIQRQEPPQEEALQPLSFEEGKEEVAPLEISIEEKVETIEEKAEAIEEEAFPKEFLEDMLKEEELKEEGLGEEELEEEGLKVEGLQEEEVKEERLLEEEELLEEAGPLEEELLEEEKPLEEETVEVFGELKEEEKIDLFEGLEAPEFPGERKRTIAKAPEVIAARAEAMKAHRLFETEVTPLRRVDQQMEEVISDRVQVMMEEFVAKHVPEMTKDIVQLTIERIEKMVRKIVPDLAEKMIEDEIKRLEKGEAE